MITVNKRNLNKSGNLYKNQFRCTSEGCIILIFNNSTLNLIIIDIVIKCL